MADNPKQWFLNLFVDRASTGCLPRADKARYNLTEHKSHNYKARACEHHLLHDKFNFAGSIVCDNARGQRM